MMAIIGPIAVAAVLALSFFVWIKIQKKLEEPISKTQAPDGVQTRQYDQADMKQLEKYELIVPFFMMCSFMCALVLAIAIASLVIRGASFVTVASLIVAIAITLGALYGYLKYQHANKVLRKKMGIKENKFKRTGK